MGADLIAYLAIGPTNLRANKKRVQAATNIAKRRINTVKAVLQLIEEYRNAKDDKERRKIAILIQRYNLDTNRSGAKTYMTVRFSSGFLDEFESEYGWLAGLDAAKAVDDLVSLWEHRARARDAVSRTHPDDRGVQIMCAGEMSWGDSPAGFGFQTLKTAEALGLFEYFGIR